MSHVMQLVVDSFLSVLGLVFFIWVIVLSIRRSDEPWKLTFKWITTPIIALVGVYLAREMGPYGPYLIAIMGIGFSIMWTPHLCDWLLNPLVKAFDGGSEPPEKRPYYSIAIAKRKSGKPLEAVMELRKQLDKFPKDFEGIMLLAAVQAEDLADLPGAEITLNKFCNLPDAPPKQVAAALTRIADWQLKLVQDADAARAALQQIIDRYPESELSLHAEQRIAHLGGTEKILLAGHDPQAVAVPEGVHNLGLLNSAAFIVPDEIEPGKLAAAYVKHLEQHPQDVEAREKLALVYAHDFKRLDLATLELAQLINERRHPPKDVARWLNLLAKLQIDLGADVATVRGTLEKIVESFPTLPLADVARRRLARIESEFRGQKETPSVKLGVYEQNIGLKRGSPREL
jgi:tetratricopeptide (TPR) repeat protein